MAAALVDDVFHSFIDAVPHGVLVADASGTIVASNRAAESLFGYTPDPLVGLPVEALVPEPLRRPHVAHREAYAVRPTNRPMGHRHDLRALRKDGSEFMAQIGISPWETSFGRHVVICVSDASDRMRAEVDAQEQHLAAVEAGEMSQAIIRESPVGIVIYDAESGHCVAANAAAATILGVPESVLLTQNFQKLESWKASGVRATAQTVLTTGVRAASEVSLRSSVGKEVTLSCNLMRITQRGRPNLVLMFDDLTARRNLEAQLRAAQKMEAIGQLAGGVAHDFNNLLTVIGTYTTLMIEDTTDADPRKEDLLEIMGAATRAATLTRQLLAFGRRQLLESKVLDLNAVVTGLEKMLRRVLSAEIELTIELAQNLGAVNADAGQIEQVLMNLVVNARDAMPQGGRLSISTSNVDGDVRSTPRGPSTGAFSVPLVMLTVTDTGTGMDEDTLNKAFEPFFTTKDPGRGTGLGLSTTYGIVKQSGGHLRARSEPGVGTTFEVLLPRVGAEAAPSGYAENAEGDLNGTGLVLVAEDDDSVRRIVVSTLRRFGYDVREAVNGEDALALPFEPGVRPDLVLTDVVMPAMSGRALADALRERWPGIPVLFTSAYATDGKTGEAASNLRGALLRKPFVPGELAAAVRNAIRGGAQG